jgi:hypothetical protein
VKNFVLLATLLVALFAIAQTHKPSAASVVQTHEPNASGGFSIPDFTCGYDGQMVSGFKDGKPVCTTPAGFITPNLKCGDRAEEPQVLVGIHDGQPVCKALHLDWDQAIQGNIYASDEVIHVRLMFMPPPPVVPAQ